MDALVPAPHERRGAGDVRRGLRGAADHRVPRGAGEELVAHGLRGVAGVLRRGAGDVGAGRHDVRLEPPVVGRAAAGEVGDVARAVGGGVRDAAAVGPARPDALGRPDGDDVLRGGLVAERGVAVPPVVPRGQDLHHGLIARIRARVAHEPVVERGGDRVVAAGRSPRVVRDPGPGRIGEGGRRGVVEGRRRRAVAVEVLRDADPRERRDAKAVVEAAGVLVRRPRPALAGGDRRDVGPVAGAVARVGVRRVVGHVGDATGEVGVGGRIGAVVEAAVGDVDREVEGVGRESLGDQPVAVARLREGGVARDDLRSALVEQLRVLVRLDRDHAGVGRQPRGLGGRQRQVLRPLRAERHRRAQ